MTGRQFDNGATCIEATRSVCEGSRCRLPEIPRLRFGLLFAVILLCTSCVDFDSQTLSFRYEKDKDELRVFQLYERIHADGSKGKLSDKEKKQLAKILNGQVSYFFNNWIIAYTPEMIDDAIGSLTKAQGKTADDEAEIKNVRAAIAFFKDLKASVKVVNGQFFLNDKQELCGYQTITVSNVSRLIKTANELANLEFQKGSLASYEEHTRPKIRQFAKDGGKWIDLDGNRFTLRLLQSKEDFKETNKDLEKLTTDGKPALKDKLQYDEPFVILTVGKPEAEVGELQIDNLREGKYNSYVLDYIRQNHKVAEKLDIATIRGEFLKSGKLPQPAKR
jgi:hypothetical protein